MLKTDNLTLHLPENGPAVFDGVSFELNKGEIGFISGPPGSGKTALGLTLCGYLPLWAGSWRLDGGIELFGQPVGQGAPAPETGLILENPYSQLSGLKRNVVHELAFPLECRGVDPADMPSIIDRYAVKLGVGHLLERNIRTLSGGELQRVLVAGALMTSPRFLFLDRPLTEIDTGFRPLLMEIIRAHTHENGGIALIAEDPWLFPAGQYDTEISLGAPVDSLSHENVRHKHVSRHETSSTEGAAALTVEGLSFAYRDGRPVLRDLSFSLGKGAVALVSGPNGSGKTTLAKLIAGILSPDKGAIVLNGRSVSAMKDWEIMSAVGLSLQNPGLHLCRKTVAEELELAVKWGNAPGKYIEILGLERLSGTHPLELSQAEKKRLGMALACGEKRTVLLLDEPTQYQDSEGFSRMVEAIDAFTDGGGAVLVITHDPRMFGAFPEAGIINLG
ncbi:ATP-binding cassette domain-containing protein [bacterium]|nr:ATP-binding cassette domain-containing protein [bacterium]